MKRNHPLYNSDNPPTALHENSSGQTAQNKSPYLKAILSGKATLFTSDKELPMINSDRIAASRYIKESAFLKKLYFDKMSC
jgi:hypothetical protein